MRPKTILVVGANRGIGLNLVKAFAQKEWIVCGSVRPETKASNDPSIKDLESTGAEILEIDFLNEQSIINAASAFGDREIDVLINCGGVNVKPRPWQEHSKEVLEEKLKIMSIGPFLSTKHFMPNLQKSKFGSIINISSNFGSNGTNFGGWLAYRMAKAALNSLTTTLAAELKDLNIAVVSVNPGFVATRLTDWDFEDDMATSIDGLVKIIENLTMEQTGQFINWNGEQIPCSITTGLEEIRRGKLRLYSNAIQFYRQRVAQLLLSAYGGEEWEKDESDAVETGASAHEFNTDFAAAMLLRQHETCNSSSASIWNVHLDGTRALL